MSSAQQVFEDIKAGSVDLEQFETWVYELNEDSYQDGFDTGHSDGYYVGHIDGYEEAQSDLFSEDKAAE